MTQINVGPLAFGRGAIYKSVQCGSITIDAGSVVENFDLPSAVNPDHSMIFNMGQSKAAGTGQDRANMSVGIALLNGSVIQANRYTDATISANIIVGYQVTEYQPGYIKSLQAGSSVGGAANDIGSTFITPVATDKFIIANGGYKIPGDSDMNSYSQPRMTLENGSGLFIRAPTMIADTTSYWQVAEFF